MPVVILSDVKKTISKQIGPEKEVTYLHVINYICSLCLLLKSN